MPIVGLILGKIDFSELSFNNITYGNFIQSIVDFLIVAACIFAMVKALEKLKRKEEEEEPAPAKPEDVALLEEIRDLLKENKKK
jgi:large conductance mechanosensitive channel